MNRNGPPPEARVKQGSGGQTLVSFCLVAGYVVGAMTHPARPGRGPG